jgi:ribosomal protein L37AE/L43A
VTLDPSKREVCVECASRELDDQLRRVFGIFVCRACTKKVPEKYSLLTKTEVKQVGPSDVRRWAQRCADALVLVRQDYLLTDGEWHIRAPQRQR